MSWIDSAHGMGAQGSAAAVWSSSSRRKTWLHRIVDTSGVRVCAGRHDSFGLAAPMLFECSIHSAGLDFDAISIHCFAEDATRADGVLDKRCRTVGYQALSCLIDGPRYGEPGSKAHLRYRDIANEFQLSWRGIRSEPLCSSAMRNRLESLTIMACAPFPSFNEVDIHANIEEKWDEVAS